MKNWYSQYTWMVILYRFRKEDIFTLWTCKDYKIKSTFSIVYLALNFLQKFQLKNAYFEIIKKYLFCFLKVKASMEL